MSSKEFVETVKINGKYEYIPKDTKFNVYSSYPVPKFEYICTVTVDGTVIKYTEDHPSDLLVGKKYIFIQIENLDEGEK